MRPERRRAWVTYLVNTNDVERPKWYTRAVRRYAYRRLYGRAR